MSLSVIWRVYISCLIQSKKKFVAYICCLSILIIHIKELMAQYVEAWYSICPFENCKDWSNLCEVFGLSWHNIQITQAQAATSTANQFHRGLSSEAAALLGDHSISNFESISSMLKTSKFYGWYFWQNIPSIDFDVWTSILSDTCQKLIVIKHLQNSAAPGQQNAFNEGKVGLVT